MFTKQFQTLSFFGKQCVKKNAKKRKQCQEMSRKENNVKKCQEKKTMSRNVKKRKQCQEKKAKSRNVEETMSNKCQENPVKENNITISKSFFLWKANNVKVLLS